MGRSYSNGKQLNKDKCRQNVFENEEHRFYLPPPPSFPIAMVSPAHALLSAEFVVDLANKASSPEQFTKMIHENGAEFPVRKA